jgi:threonine aldolase
MRQAGILAAAGLYALQNHRKLLIEDHRRARELAQTLAEIEGLSLEYPVPSSNMVYLNLDEGLPVDAQQAAELLKKEHILVGITGRRQFRLVTHLWISDEDVTRVIEAFRKIVS